MVALSWLGGLIAGAIAIGEAFARRSPRAVLLAVPLAAAGGCAAGWIGSLAYEAFGIGPLASLGDTVKAQAPMLGLLGAGVGLALGGSHLSLRGGLALSGAGLLAGLLASLVYPVAVSVLLPTASTDSLIPQGAVNRLVWIGIAAGLLGATVAGAARPRQSRTPGRQREGTKS